MTTVADPPLSCGVVVVRWIEGEPRFLLLRAYQHWDFPKGLMERGELPLEAAVREVAEETSLTGLDFHWGEYYYETAPYGPHRKIARYYLAESAQGEVFLPDSPELGHPEHEEFVWADYAQASRLVSPRVLQVLEWACDLLEADAD